MVRKTANYMRESDSAAPVKYSVIELMAHLDLVEAKAGRPVQLRKIHVAEKFSLARHFEFVDESSTQRLPDKGADTEFWALEKMDKAYEWLGSVKNYPAIFWRFYGDVYAVSTPNPVIRLIDQNFNDEAVRPEIYGMPYHLHRSIDENEYKKLVKAAQEAQLHFARLEYLSEIEGMELVAIALNDLKRALLSALSGFDDYNGSRWHSVHASEKIIKALLKGLKKAPRSKNQRKKRQTHSLRQLAYILKSETGISLPRSLEGSLHRTSASKRYQFGGKYELAIRDFRNALRLGSVAFFALRDRLTVPNCVWHNLDDATEFQGRAREMIRLRYPGITTTAHWQPLLVDTYGTPIA